MWWTYLLAFSVGWALGRYVVPRMRVRRVGYRSPWM